MELQRALLEDNIRDYNIEANFFYQEHQDDEVRNQWIDRAIDLADIPNSRNHYEENLRRLFTAAKFTRKRALDQSTSSYDMREAKLQRDAEDTTVIEQKQAIMYWKHWNPRGKDTRQITKKTTENALRHQWATRLIANLVKHSPTLPYIKKYRSETPKLLDLLGRTRWATIKIHCMTYENIRKTIGTTPVPWTDKTITDAMQWYQKNKRAPSQLRKYWSTVRWISKHFGSDDPQEATDISSMYDSALGNMTTKLYTEPKQAVMPDMDDIKNLEHAATDIRLTRAERYAASVFRWQVGTSGRFDDIQHTSPHTVHHDNENIVGIPWQTKTMDNVTRKTPKALISTKHTLTGKNWWKPMTDDLIALYKARPHMDYILPQPGSMFNSFLDRPCTYSTALTWLRQILHRQGTPAPRANKTTLHSLRLWMAEMAHLARVPREMRKHIGQWANEKTADTYTRDHARIITDIWQMVLNKPPDSHHCERPVDPSDAYYLKDEKEKAEIAQEKKNPTNTGKTVTCRYPEELGGPLTVAVRNKPTGNDNHRKAHFFRTDHRAVGHGNMTYNPMTSQIVTGPDDWKSIIKEHKVRLCQLCTRTSFLPTDWDANSEDTDNSDNFTDTDESDHLTDSAADTESENEALRMD